MLFLYRRHLPTCRHKPRGRRYWMCQCPIWVDGRINGRRIRASTGLTDWTEAQALLPKWMQEGRVSTQIPKIEIALGAPKTLEEAWHDFIERKLTAQRLSEATRYKYTHLQRQMQELAERHQVTRLEEFTLDMLEELQSARKDAPITCLKWLERLKAFFNFSFSRGWIDKNPAANLCSPKVPPKPTLPFTSEEMKRILSAIDEYPDKSGRTGQVNAERLRALVLLLRYSGLRIGDAVRCKIDQLQGANLFVSTQKTGQAVCCPLPTHVVSILNRVPRLSDDHFFWTRKSKLHTAVGTWQRSLRNLFILAGIENGHAHRFRDTFAVELLLTGTSIEEVAVLLGHSNIKVTQKHYNPWVLKRQKLLESNVQRSWRDDPILLAMGTRRVRREGSQKANLFIIGGKGLVPAGGIEPTA
jgi:integrase/recombinase XerD